MSTAKQPPLPDRVLSRRRGPTRNLLTGLVYRGVCVARLHPGLAGIYRRKVGDVYEALAGPGARDEAFGLLRGLIERCKLQMVEGGLFGIDGSERLRGAVSLFPPPQADLL